MVRNQDDASFVTWAATLHPEAAVSSIDTRYQHSSPWVTVYNETWSDVTLENMPVALDVVQVDDELEANPQQPQDTTIPLHNGLDAHLESPPSSPAATHRPQPWKHSNLLDLILGFALSLTAFLWTIKIELSAIIIYTIAAGFHYIAEEYLNSTAAMLGKSICLIITSVLMIVDAVLLTVSVLVTEILGGVAFLLCSLFGGPRSGSEWHQFIRKTCHLTRWGFRNCHTGWKPNRIFPLSMDDEATRLHHPVPQQEEIGGGPHMVQHSEHCESPMASSCPTMTTIFAADASTVESTLTEDLAQHRTIAIGPENVQVINEEDPDESNFAKNSQQVIIT